MSQEAKTIFKANILAVDDTPANLQLLIELLSRQTYKVRTIPDSSLVLKSALASPPDLILLDILMPGMDGYQVCQALKANPITQNIPVIFLSALSEGFDKVKAFSVGGVDYITKPFLAEEVIARIDNQLRLKAQEKQLEEKAQQLELTLKDLQSTQAQLIQTEKMLSLGRMVAGIAHEINNPISFISGNISYARNYFQDLMSLVELYQQTYPCPTPEIQELSEEIELSFLVEDWLKLTDSMQVGATRIQKIVQSLKHFARLDEAELKLVDIHEGIDNTLLLLQHRLKAEGNRIEIKVIKNYGLLPKITCYASQLNQVFMHLLANAIDAVKNQPEPRITITTSLANCQPTVTSNQSTVSEQKQQTTNVRLNFDSSTSSEHRRLSCRAHVEANKQQTTNNKQQTTNFVVMKIADNGRGMSQDVLDKIFDPFFTTKPVGSGTGLGLSICHQIVVEKHKGKINCISAPGQGTKLIVEIPDIKDKEDKEDTTDFLARVSISSSS